MLPVPQPPGLGELGYPHHMNIQPAGTGDGTASSNSMTKAIKRLCKILLSGIVEKIANVLKHWSKLYWY